MNYSFIKVYFINENTEGLNSYFGRNNDPMEWAILPIISEVDEFEASDLLDEFLASVCYCDAYRFESFEVLQGVEADCLPCMTF